MKNWKLNKVAYLAKKWSYMQDRVSHRSKSVEGRSYYKLPICSKAQFLSFALKDENFNKLFAVYKMLKGPRKHAPSVDRINTKRGYVLGNMQFLTVSHNSKKRIDAYWVVLQDSVTKKTYRFTSATQAGAFLGHKWHIHTDRTAFINLKNGKKYLNKSGLVFP